MTQFVLCYLYNLYNVIMFYQNFDNKYIFF